MFLNFNDAMFAACRKKRRPKHQRYAALALNSGLLESGLSAGTLKVLHVSSHCPANQVMPSHTPLISFSFSNLSKGEEEDVEEEEEEQVVLGE